MAGWDFSTGGGTQTYDAFKLFDPGTWGNFFKNPTNQLNPYTQGWMGQVGNEQNQLSNWLFGGGGPGGGGGALAAYMNPMTEGGFMSNFLGAAPALQGLTRSASEEEKARAATLGQEGQNMASAGFAGLGGKYSGANLLAGNKAYQDSMGDLSGKIASENFSLLNNLYGNTLNNMAAAQGQGLGNMFNLYGLNAGNLAGAAAPMFAQGKSPWQGVMDLGSMLLGGAGGMGSLFSGLGSLAKAGGFPALFPGA